jgi:sigma-B regulation protein RsbU (phosphoserine phosphatase)
MNKGPMHILLIEDNPGDADLVRLRLVEGNPELDVACADRLSSGMESLLEDKPAVVLLDLNLPDSRGAETFRNILEKAPGVPVVVLSGHDDEELALKAVNQGVQDYLVKGSFDSKQLARAMRYAMERQALLTSLDISRKQQLQFKDQFLSHVSHELRTPLTCIHQFVSILLDGLAGPIPAEQREHLETVMHSANQLRSMIGHLLEATRVETGKIHIEQACMSAGTSVDQAIGMMRASAQAKQIGLEAAVDARIPLLHGDPERVLQILVNLIENAIKFTLSGGSVIVKAYLIEADPEFVHFSVADTGQGISPASKALIFERLYQDPEASDNSRKGLGLGLYIVQELVRLHGGRIWVESQLAHGSTFSFTLPLFSLAKLLLPVITEQGKLRQAVTLVQVDLTARAEDIGDWDQVRKRCRELLQGSILSTKDLLLPALVTSGQKECFLLVASADARGAEVLMRRIENRLENDSQLSGKATFRVSAIPVLLPAGKEGEPLQKLVKEVADVINAMAFENLGRNSNRTKAIGNSTN